MRNQMNVRKVDIALVTIVGRFEPVLTKILEADSKVSDLKLHKHKLQTIAEIAV